MTQIHLRIGDLRRQKKITQQELADQVGVSYQTVSRWETGAGEPELSRNGQAREISGIRKGSICCAPERVITMRTMWIFW